MYFFSICVYFYYYFYKYFVHLNFVRVICFELEVIHVAFSVYFFSTCVYFYYYFYLYNDVKKSNAYGASIKLLLILVESKSTFLTAVAISPAVCDIKSNDISLLSPSNVI